jgi:glycerophosphoryl diester phosphodiesterase
MENKGVGRPDRARLAQRVLSKMTMAALRRGGLSVTNGTVNDVTLLRRVAAIGVDAVTTDDPAALRARPAIAA